MTSVAESMNILNVVTSRSNNYIPLDHRKCPICQTIQQKSTKINQIAEKLGFETKQIKYCPFHYKLIKILSMFKDSNAKRIFRATVDEKTIKINFGCQNDEKKATILIIIPRKGGFISVVVNGRLYKNVSPEILGIFTPKELDVINQYLSE